LVIQFSTLCSSKHLPCLANLLLAGQTSCLKICTNSIQILMKLPKCPVGLCCQALSRPANGFSLDTSIPCLPTGIPNGNLHTHNLPAGKAEISFKPLGCIPSNSEMSLEFSNPSLGRCQVSFKGTPCIAGLCKMALLCFDPCASGLNVSLEGSDPRPGSLKCTFKTARVHGSLLNVGLMFGAIPLKLVDPRRNSPALFSKSDAGSLVPMHLLIRLIEFLPKGRSQFTSQPQGILKSCALRLHASDPGEGCSLIRPCCLHCKTSSFSISLSRF